MFPKFCISYRFTFMFVCVQLYRKCACITERLSAGHIQPVFLVKIVSVIDKHLSTHVHTFIHTCIYTRVQLCVCVGGVATWIVSSPVSHSQGCWRNPFVFYLPKEKGTLASQSSLDLRKPLADTFSRAGTRGRGRLGARRHRHWREC